MKLELKPFQEAAVDDLLEDAAEARRGALKGREQALILGAPTGSGKTVVATSWLERLVMGDEHHEPNPEATFLWITDQKDLNEQTKRKVLDGSDVFDASTLVTIEAETFDQEFFEPGVIYFLNTQKLMRTSRLTSANDGDFRDYSIWETIANTSAARPASFWVVIDEAHRGMRENGSSREDAGTIIQKFIKGSDEIAPIPLIFGISATTQRFTDLLGGTSRTQRPTVVDAADVRASGLLKESIIINHPEDEKHSDFTLLADAAARAQEYADAWRDYAKREKQPPVQPILVVQVEDGTKTGKTQLTRTDLEEALQMAEKMLGPLEPDEVAHSFQEGSTVLIGEQARALHYVAPSDIEDQTRLRVIFFKRTLTTGWDCPRAEVMMSFRTAKDETLITQLVGRMVRTPLARHVTDGDLLNSVSLYLPYYDEKHLESVIQRLSKEDPDSGIAGTAVIRGNQRTTLRRAPKTQEIFAVAHGLPIYRVERVRKLAPVKRLVKLGLRLGWDGLDCDAHSRFTDALVQALDAERKKVARKKAFKDRLAEVAQVGVRAVTLKAGETTPVKEESRKLLAVERNIHHAYGDVARRLGDTGIANAYLKHRVAQDKAADLSALKLELYALLEDGTRLAAVEAKADELADEALDQHEVAINSLPDDKRQLYRAIRLHGSTSRPEPWELPRDIDGSRDGDRWEKHIYVKKDGSYTHRFNQLEEKVLAEELKRSDVVGWLRNEPNKPWAFRVNYKRHGDEKEMFPDFIIFREQNGSIVVDVLEPHSQRESDSVAKANGLAEFASKHGNRFGRIELIDEIQQGNQTVIKRLPLKQGKWQKLVMDTHTEGHLRQHFENAP